MGEFGRMMFRREIVVEDEYGHERVYPFDSECEVCGDTADGVLAYKIHSEKSDIPGKAWRTQALCDDCADAGRGARRLKNGKWERFRRSSK